jgi:hypothetical protein
MRAVMLLPDPAMGPDRWTQRSYELRNQATIEGRCSVCGYGIRFEGVDFREMRHSTLHHAPDCRCGDDRIIAHLNHRGLRIEDERYLVYVVDLESGHWALEGAA